MLKKKNSAEIVSRSVQETRKIAGLLAAELKKLKNKKSTVVALTGNLGSGKTTFTQGFAGALGVKEKVLSPTFVLMKVYKIKSGHFVHIDCYRIDSFKEIEQLGLKKIFEGEDAIILIEWADKVRKLIPRNALWIRFEHGAKPHERVLIFNFQWPIFNGQFSSPKLIENLRIEKLFEN